MMTIGMTTIIGIVTTTVDAGNTCFNSRFLRLSPRVPKDARSMSRLHLVEPKSRWRFMSRLPLILVMWLLFIGLSLCSASAKESITWLEVSMPPYLVQDGPYKNEGYGNVVSAILREHLPEYDHQVVVTNVIRHFDRFKKGEKVCSIGLYRTPERETFMHFSIPSLLTMPAVLITTKEKLALFGESRSIKLNEVLANPRFILGLSKDRSYGATVDAILKTYRNKTNLVLYSGQELSANYFRMLMLDRLDGLIGLPDEAMYHAEQLGLRDQLATLIIEENRQDYAGWLCAVGCTKDEWGRAVIDRINAVLLEQRPTASYRAAYERWLDPAHLEQYRSVYQAVFLQSAPPRH